MWAPAVGAYRGRVSALPLPPLPPHWTSSAQPQFVGRQRELDVLEVLWPQVEAGARQVVFVGGEPGAGKTRLTMEAGLALHANGIPVLYGACTADFGEPFDPFVAPVRTLLPTVGSGAVDLGGDDPTATAGLLGLVAGGASEVALPSTSGTGLPAAPAVFEAVTELLRGCCRDQPALLVLDDVNWAGESALRMLRYVVERTAALPLMVMVTMRTSAPDRSASLSRMVGEVFRLDGVTRIDLAGLDTDAIAQYLVHGCGPLTPDIRGAATRLRDETGGNPFLLREVCRELDASGGLAGLAAGGVRTPESVRAMVEGRLDELAPAQRRVVQVASVIGDEFTVPLLAAALEEDGDQDVAVTFEALAATRAVGLVEGPSGADATYCFPHALARQAVTDTLDDYRRATAHARVAVALEQRFPSAPSREQRLGHHFASATGLGLEERAAHHLAAAGDAARARLAHADAGSLYERAARFAASPDRRDDLLLQASQSYHFASQTGRALEVAEQVATAGSTPRHRLRAAVGFEGASWRTAQPADRSIELLTSALDLEPPDPADPVYVRAVAALGRAQAYAGNFTEGMRLCDDAVSMARELRDARLLASVLQVALQDGTRPEGMGVRLARAEELTALIEASGEYHRMGAPAFHRCLAHTILGEPAALARAHADLARAARDTQQHYWQWVLASVTSALAVGRADFSLARAEVDRSHQFGELIDRSETEGPWALQSFMIRRETGDLAHAGRVLRSITADSASMWEPGLTALYTELGWVEEAAHSLHAAMDHDLGRYRRSASWPAVLSFLGEAATRLADHDAAARLLPLAEQHAGRNLVASEFLATFGSGDRLIGMLQSVLGIATADHHFDRALDMDRRMGAVLHEATTLAEYSVHLRRRGASDAEVRARRAPAQELARRHGLARVLRILGPDGGAAPSPNPDGLTTRELDVLRLVGRGTSNRDIATALFISENTAANHVRSILMKTRCANRTQAARYALDRGLAIGSESDRAP